MFPILLKLLLFCVSIKSPGFVFERILDERNLLSIEEFVSDYMCHIDYIDNLIIKLNVIKYAYGRNSLTNTKIPKNIIGLEIYTFGNYDSVKFLFVQKNSIKYLKLVNFNTYGESTVGKLLKYYQNLETLELSDTYFYYMDVTSLHQLRVLKGKNWRLHKFPANFSSLKIKHLSLIGCIYNILASIRHLDNEERKKTEIQSVFKELFKNKTLNSIDLQYNMIGHYDIDFSQFSGSVLNLSSNLIEKINSSICTLKKLEVLDLSDNFIEEIPREFCNLIELKVLNLSANKNCKSIIKLPWDNMRLLDISSNKKNMERILHYPLEETTLVIEGNNFLQIALSKFKYRITSLFIIDRYYNTYLTMYDESDTIISYQLSHFPNVKNITVNINSFSFFTREFFTLKKLRFLQISIKPNRGIENADEEFLNYFVINTNLYLNIETLRYSSYTLTNFPQYLFNIKTIKHFHIHNCIIDSKIKNISRMVYLEKLDFTSCHFLINIKYMILKVKRLKNINFKNNKTPDDMNQRDIKISVLKKL
ncbi:Leucine rich repeat protein [Spraguea lophii 42_110]|uniref:Leucine rich repeat protein n=1 Tax=Spraguea lophii (strain 42_110) TaxID=1358809 RepID=S7W4U9_SPRLO|nr:Leucine rich repeat protein [Spraguea lophii 42_110]